MSNALGDIRLSAEGRSVETPMALQPLSDTLGMVIPKAQVATLPSAKFSFGSGVRNRTGSGITVWNMCHVSRSARQKFWEQSAYHHRECRLRVRRFRDSRRDGIRVDLGPFGGGPTSISGCDRSRRRGDPFGRACRTTDPDGRRAGHLI